MTQNERLNKIRKTLNLTMEKFGECIGVSKTTISGIETGRRNLTEHMLKSISREFNVNEDWLRNETGEMFNTPNDEVASILSEIMQNPDSEFYQMILKLVHTYLELSPESQRVMDEYIHSFTDKIKKEQI